MEKDFAPQIFEAVTAYAIDDPRRTEDDRTILDELGLDETTFCERLYVSRPGNKESDLEKYILKGSRAILVYGFPGTGKTSLVAKVLHKLAVEKHEFEILPFRVDFKELEHREEARLAGDLRTYVTKELLHHAKVQLRLLGVAEHDVVRLLLGEGGRRLQVSHAFEDGRYTLFGEYKRSGSEDVTFDDWIDARLKAEDSRLVNAVSDLAKALRIQDFLFYLTFGDPARQRLCVLVFDNVDSIVANDTREAFYRYVRGLQSALGSFARVVAVGRTSNLVKEQLSDSGTYLVDDVEIDYRAFVDEAEYERRCKKCIERKGFCSELDKLNIQSRLESAAKERFAREMLSERTKYLDWAVEHGRARSFDSANMSRIRDLYDLAMANRHIYSSTLDLTNLDRRKMLMHISNFVRFVAEPESTRFTDLGLDRDERSFVLESYFYHWIYDREAITGLGVYDLVRDWQLWDTSRTVLGCSFTHLLIASIYNLTGRVRGKHSYIPRTTIEQVVERLARLGYGRDDVLQRIIETYKHGTTYFGILETDRFYQVESLRDLGMGDAIWLTPRAAYICEYLCLKLLFMLSCLRKNQFRVDGVVFSFDDSNPVTVQSLTVNLKFLCRLAEMHIRGLAEVKERLEGTGHGGSWLLDFRRYFCIRAHDTASDDGVGDLLFRNTITSHKKFLLRQSGIDPWRFIEEMRIVEWYERLAKAFDKDLRKLEAGKLDLSNVGAADYERRIRLAQLGQAAKEPRHA